MGCGASRPTTDDRAVMGLGLRPKIHRKGPRTHSTKAPLIDGDEVEEEGNSLAEMTEYEVLEKESDKSDNSKSDEETDDRERVGQPGFADLPGSPSFREYYSHPVCELRRPFEGDEERGKDARNPTHKTEENGGSVNSSEKSESKKHEKGGKLRALVKARLHVGSCYHPSSTDSPKFLNAKAA